MNWLSNPNVTRISNTGNNVLNAYRYLYYSSSTKIVMLNAYR